MDDDAQVRHALAAGHRGPRPGRRRGRLRRRGARAPRARTARCPLCHLRHLHARDGRRRPSCARRCAATPTWRSSCSPAWPRWRRRSSASSSARSTTSRSRSLIEEVRARVDKALEKRDLVLQNRFYQQHLESRVRELDRRNKQSLINGVQMLVHALEAKDAYTSGHSTRVEPLRREDRGAARLHRRPARADPPRRRAARHRQDRHPRGHPEQARAADARRVRAHQGAHGAGRADPGAVPGRIADACSGSSARTTSGWTAAAFPTASSGDAIPLEARIVAVVDAFDAMTTNRAYRPVPDARRRGRRAAALRRHPFRSRRRRGVPRGVPATVAAASHLRLTTPAPPPMSDTLMISVSGMRGHVGTDLTPELVARHAAALGAWVRGASGEAPRPSVVLGRDARTSGPMFARAATAGLMSVGVDVIDLGIVPTPTVQMAVEHHHAGAGLILTASHNPDRMERAQVRRARRHLPRRRGGRRGAGAGRAGPAASRAGTGSARCARIARRSRGTSTRSSRCR